MESEYKKIISMNEIDKFVLSNKFELENISDFINYITSNRYSYLDYKILFTSLLDIRHYSDLPSVFLSLIRSEYDLEDLIDVCDKLSVNIIVKFKISPLLSDILNLLIGISNILYDKEWYYECTIILYTISLFITNCNIHNKTLFSDYYKVISQILLLSNNYYSALNALNMTDDKENREMYKGLVKYKNEGNKYSQFLLKMDYIDFDSDYTGAYGEYWDFYIKNIGNKIPISKDNIKFISFMKRNNINYTKEDNFLVIGRYEYESVDQRVCDIIDMYKIKKDIFIKRPEDIIKDVVVNNIIKKKKEIIFSDNFLIKKAKFNIYCDILQSTNKDEDLYYDFRNNNRKKLYEEYNNILRDKKAFYNLYYDDLTNLLTELSIQKQTIKQLNISKVGSHTRSSWRDEVYDVKPSIYTSNLKKKTETISERNIYTYGDGCTSVNENVFKPNLKAYKGENVNQGIKSENANQGIKSENIFKPNVADIKITKKEHNVYTPPTKTDNVGQKPYTTKEENKNTYTPPSNQGNTRNISFMQNKSSSWYDENK